MASQFQNRIAGAVVLVALGVIILPGFLDGDKKHYQSEFAAIPIIPEREGSQNMGSLPPATEPLPEFILPNDVENVVNPPFSGGSDELTGGNTTPVTEKPGEATTGNETAFPRGKAYVVQLGVLVNAAKVEEIKAMLSFANYTVFTVPATAIQGKSTYIFIGPDASKQKLESVLPALEKLTGLKGVVKEHKVTK